MEMENVANVARICSAIYHGLLFPIVGRVDALLAQKKGQSEFLKPCLIEFA